MRAASREALAAAQERLDQRAQEGADLTEVADGLLAVAGLLHRQRALTRALADNDAAPEARAALLDAVLGSRIGAVELDVLRELVASRWSRPTDLIEVVDALGAQAAFTAAERSGELDEVEDELFRFGRLVDREPALRAALTDTALPADNKRALLHDLLDARVRPVTVRLLEDLVLDPRGRSLDAGIVELSRLAAERRQRMLVGVKVARPLDPDQAQRLVDALTKLYGRPLQLQVELDPGVLGGAVVQVDDEVYDGTVARRLSDVRARLG